jgi:putative transposase
MMRFTFKKGLIFKADIRKWTLMRMLVTGKLQFESDQGEFVSLDMKEVLERWRKEEWVLDEESLGIASDVFYTATPRDLSSYPQPLQQHAIRRQSYVTRVVQKFADEGKIFSSTPKHLISKIVEVARELNDSTPPSWNTLHRWYKMYSPTKCITKLLDRRSRSGRRHDPVMSGIYEEAAMEVFLTPQKLPAKAVYEAVVLKIARMNKDLSGVDMIRLPGRASIYRWLKNLHQGLVMRARLGKAMTKRQLRCAMGGVKTTKVLERVEIDHTPTNLLVIDRQTHLVLGRPWLTLAIDRHSRAIMGFYLSFHGPSAYSVLYCLRQAILPKEEILRRFPDIRNMWLCFGIPDLVATDNGMDLHADAVESLCADLGVEILYCPSGEPQLKAAIERLMRTIAEDLFHKLPGTTFASPKERGDYDSEKNAAIDLEDLTHIITKWIVDVYNHTQHRGLGGLTPAQAWADGSKSRHIELPAYPAQLDVIIGNQASRKVFHYGIEIDNLRYNSPLLQAIVARNGGPISVEAKIYEHDVSFVNVLDPHVHEYIRVPAVNQDYAAGVTRRTHRMVCARIAALFGNGWRNEHLLEAKTEIQAIVAAAVQARQ